MSTQLSSWSKMSFHKKLKPAASTGQPSPRSSRKGKGERSTRSEVRKIDLEDNNNRHQQTIEEAEFRQKLALESKLGEGPAEKPFQFCTPPSPPLHLSS